MRDDPELAGRQKSCESRPALQLEWSQSQARILDKRTWGGVNMLELQEKKSQPRLTPKFKKRARFALWGLLLLVFLEATGVLSVPLMPGFEPDTSWPYGMNQAVAQGLTFGRDIIFTYGPYASVFTQCYHPATVWRMLLGTLLLDGLYIGCIAGLAKSARLRWPFILACIALLPTTDRDAFFFSIPLVVSLVVFKSQLPPNEKAPQKNSTKILLVLAFACLGILPLVKGTYLLLTAAMCMACSLFLLINGRKLQAILCLIAPSVSMILLWIAVGQPLSALPAYFINMRFLISGYSEAMALQAQPWVAVTIEISLAAAIGLLLIIALKRSLKRDEKALLLFVYLLFLFLAFKEGTVRQDFPHIPVELSAVMLGSLLLPLLSVDGVLSFSSGTALILAFVSNALIAVPLYANAANQLGNQGPRKWMSEKLHNEVLGFAATDWQKRFEDSQRAMNAKSKLDFPMTGTVDMYANLDMDSLFCKGYRWDPRPIIVSYAAFTPELARLNEQHLRGADAPDDLVVRLEPLDGHPPALEDGLSWPAMLDNYAVTGDDHGWIRLTRKAAIRKASQYLALGAVGAHLGEEVQVPAADTPLFIAIDERATPWGKLLAIAHKPPLLSLTVTTASGAKFVYPVSAARMVSGFFLSPLVRDNAGFVRLFDSKAPIRPDDKVKSILLDVSGGTRTAWSNRYMVRFQEYEYE